VTVPAAHPQSAEILAALPLRERPGLYIAAEPDRMGRLTILDRGQDPDDGPVESIVGLAIPNGPGWYLACTECAGEIDEADGGMCRPCRQDMAARAQDYLADEPEEPLPAAAGEDY
jgi:hypothetical protein